MIEQNKIQEAVQEIFTKDKQELKRIHFHYISLLETMEMVKEQKRILTNISKENIDELKKIFQHHYDGYLEIIKSLEKMLLK